MFLSQETSGNLLILVSTYFSRGTNLDLQIKIPDFQFFFSDYLFRFAER